MKINSSRLAGRGNDGDDSTSRRLSKWVQYLHHTPPRGARVLHRLRGDIVKISTKARCIECERVFDLLDDNDASEWAYGHDCEV
jgi:hypothetical protein